MNSRVLTDHPALNIALARAGVGLGIGREEMDRDRAREYLASGEGAAELEAELAEARELGVRAVPTFVFEGRWLLEGAQPVSTFLSALERVAAGA